MIYGREITEELFLEDVREHKVKVLLDTDTHKHIRFQAPNTNFSWFDLVAWPGHLCVTGDMTTYVFMRESDMFELFRPTFSADQKSTKLSIKPEYWAPKCISQDMCNPVKEWDRELFKEKAREDLADFIYSSGFSGKGVGDAWQRFEDEVIYWLDERCKEEAYGNIVEFKVNGRHPFHDWYEVDTDKYSDSFLWSCYAIVWGIKMYDKYKEAEARTNI